MRSNLQKLQLAVSVLAILSLVLGWFHFFSEEITAFLSQRLFYILVGLSLALQGRMLSFTNPRFVYPMYIVAALCVIGACLPVDSQLEFIKSLGFLLGIVISVLSRSQYRRS